MLSRGRLPKSNAVEVRPCPPALAKGGCEVLRSFFPGGATIFTCLLYRISKSPATAEAGQWKKGSEVAILVRPADLDSDRASLMKLTNRLLTPRSPQGFDWLYRSNPFGPARAVLAG